MCHWSQEAKGTQNLTINKKRASGKTIFLLFEEKKIKNKWFSGAFPPNSFRSLGSLNPNMHDTRATNLTQRVFFYSSYSGIAKIFSLPFCGSVEALPACLGMPWWCFDPFEKIFPTPKAPGELGPLSLLYLTIGAPSMAWVQASNGSALVRWLHAHFWKATKMQTVSQNLTYSDESILM